MTEISKVIENGYCIGCGACAFVEPDVYTIRFNENGEKQAYSTEPSSHQTSNERLADKVCPFSANAANESEISHDLFGDNDFSYDQVLGHYDSLYAGHVEEGSYRDNGSSGGMVSWLINELFAKDQIDYVVHVKEKDENNLFAYSISGSSEEAMTASKSKYYPISLEEVLKQVKQREGRFLFIGIPCFIKTIRNVALLDRDIAQKLEYTAGLVCGHLKSQFFSYNYSMQLGVHPDQLARIDFRHMESSYDGPANQYFVKVTDTEGGTKIRQNVDFYGYLWGHGFFKYKACDYCDDVFAETADICLGDAWIQPYVKDPAGDNIVVLRNNYLSAMIKDAISSGRLKLDAVSESDVKKSQEAGIRHRRDGVIARTKFKKALNKWHPKKRYLSGDYLGRTDLIQKSIYVYREFISQSSMKHFRKAMDDRDYEQFKRKMKPIMFIYNRVLYFPFSRIKSKLLSLKK